MEEVAKALRLAVGGMDVGLLHQPKEKEAVTINVRLPERQRSSVTTLASMYVASPHGPIPLSQLVKSSHGTESKTLYRKNLKNVVYVVGDVAGVQVRGNQQVGRMKITVAQPAALRQSFQRSA